MTSTGPPAATGTITRIERAGYGLRTRYRENDIAAIAVAAPANFRNSRRAKVMKFPRSASNVHDRAASVDVHV